MNEMTQVNKDKLIADFKVVIADAEEILRATTGQAGEKIADLREKAQARLTTAKIKLAETEAILVDKANIRSTGATSAAVAAVAEIGEIYKVLGKKGDWVQLGYYDNSSPLGWIRHDLVFGE